MLKSYVIITIRNLWRNKLYTVLNIAGLAIGIASCLIIYLIVSFELNHDTFHPDKDRIYRITTQFSGTFEGSNSGVPAPLPFAVRNEFSGIETVAAFHTLYNVSVSLDKNAAKESVFKEVKDIIVTEPTFFDLFSSYKWLAGSPGSSLSAPFQVVLTESKARTYFGTAHPQKVLGRTIYYNDSLTVTVSGIVKDLPRPTDLFFSDFISFSTIEHSWLKHMTGLDNWQNTNSSSQAFVKIKPEVQESQINAQLKQMAQKYSKNEEDQNWRTLYKMQPLSDLHFDVKLGIFDSYDRLAAHLPTLRILILVSGLILFIAAINFINLVTAQAVKRAKEVGIRKVLGSTRSNLIFQFLSETLCITAFAVFVSTLLATIALPYFQEFIPEGAVLDFSDPSTLLFLLITVVVVSLLSGLYPAFMLSAFAPVLALKNQAYAATGKTRTAFLRKGLIVFQFAFAQVLIAGTFIVGSQINFMLNKDMGFDTDAIVYFRLPHKAKDQGALMKQEFAKIPGISAISMHAAPPASGGVASSTMDYDNGQEIVKHHVHQKYGDTAYLAVYDIPLIAGRNLLVSDTIKEYIINETYARQLGFSQPQEALGKIFNKYFPIVGVVKDFHVQSLHHSVPPVAIAYAKRNHQSFSLKLATQGKGIKDFQETMEKVQVIWKGLYPEDNFTYSFMDDHIARFYAAEKKTAKLAGVATGMAIFISCLGLFGLATYTAQQRTKEIGIRKVLGASVTGITLLLSKDFTKLVLLAFIIAFPIAWYAVNQWLADFAYQIQVNIWLFIGSGVVAITIALVTVGYQSIKAAMANPVKSLRSE